MITRRLFLAGLSSVAALSAIGREREAKPNTYYNYEIDPQEAYNRYMRESLKALNDAVTYGEGVTFTDNTGRVSHIPIASFKA